MGEILSGLDYLTYYFYLLYYKFIGYPLVLRICIAVVTLCAVSYLFLSFYLVYGIFRRKREKSLYDRIYKRYYQPLTDVLSEQENRRVDEIAEQLHHDIRHRLKHDEMRFLVEVITVIKTELGDKVNNYNMQSVQGVFKIGSFFEREIQFGSTKHKMQALHSIQSINGYVSEAVLVRFLYHRSVQLRQAARFAYMWLSQNNPFRFFDEDITMNLHTWDMAELHTILLHRQDMGFAMPNFIKWVNSSVENSTRTFFVNEIRLFNQTENCAPLEELLLSKNWSLRGEVVRTLGAMKYAPAEPHFIGMYDVQPEYIKENIITAVTNMRAPQCVEFLHSAYEQADDMSTKLFALKAMYGYSAEGRMQFEQLETSATGFAAKLFAHVRNPITNPA